jgi:hypothetical protein
VSARVGQATKTTATFMGVPLRLKQSRGIGTKFRISSLDIDGSGNDAAMPTSKAAGPFDVTMAPEPHYEATDGGVVLGRVGLEKHFHGDLDATSLVRMLSAGGSIKGSAGYVAIERVTGHLHGRAGSFVLQHSGSMNRGEASLTVTVVPDTGTGELAGLSGSMTIDIVDGKHSYVFEYSLG